MSRIQASSVEISTTRIDGGEQRAAVLELGIGHGHGDGLGGVDRLRDGRVGRCAGFAPRRQLSGRSGQAIQQPACGSNSPGMR